MNLILKIFKVYSAPLNNRDRHKYAISSPLSYSYSPICVCVIGVTDNFDNDFLWNHSFVPDKTSRSGHLKHCKYGGNLILFLYDSP